MASFILSVSGSAVAMNRAASRTRVKAKRMHSTLHSQEQRESRDVRVPGAPVHHQGTASRQYVQIEANACLWLSIPSTAYEFFLMQNYGSERNVQSCNSACSSVPVTCAAQQRFSNQGTAPSALLTAGLQPGQPPAYALAPREAACPCGGSAANHTSAPRPSA